jgi:vanillin dehydrogenase
LRLCLKVREAGGGLVIAEGAVVDEVTPISSAAGSDWVAGDEAQEFASTNPLDDGVIAYVRRSTAEQVTRSVTEAQAAWGNYSTLLASRREDMLCQAAVLLERDRSEFADLLIEEIGSPISKANFEIDMAVSAFRAAAGAARRSGGRTYPSDTPGRFSLSVREPRGVVASITPFNVPLLIGVRSSANPLAYGNTVVALVSEHAPLIGLRLEKLYREAGFGPGVFNVITGYGAEIGDALVGDPRIRAVSFTGSSVIGKHVARLCSEQLKPAILELGGKNPLIILDDADLDRAVEGAVFSIFLYQGQVCMGASRIYVAEPVYESFRERFVAAANALSCGNLRNTNAMIGPIISPRQRERIRHHIDDALRQGAALLCGGSWEGNCCRPTVLEGVREGMVVFDEETFGPVTSLYRFDLPEEAMKLANTSRFGLSAAVYTQNVTKALEFARGLKAGMVHINAPTLLDEPHVPFGGVRDSGMGRAGTDESLDVFTELKWITVQT